MPGDPKLKAAAEEIKAVLRKYDIGANIVLANVGFIEYVRHFEASWSCARMEGPNELRIRSKLADYPDKAAQKLALESTLGMVVEFAAQAERDREVLTELAMRIGKDVGISHWSRQEGN